MSGELTDNDAVLEGQILRPSQLRRIEALLQARKILETRAGLFNGSNLQAARSINDLTYLANYIIDGANDDDEMSVDEVKRTWQLGYGEGAHAALTHSGLAPERADEIKAELGITSERIEPQSGTWEPGPPTFGPEAQS